jgi:hypothetical protein
VLNLVYNPQGPSLPPPQAALEADYKRELMQHFGIRFNHLFALTNMPIQRFGSTLVSKGTVRHLHALLRSSYRADNLDTVMCRSLVSVDWQGICTTATSTRCWACRPAWPGIAAPTARPAAARRRGTPSAWPTTATAAPPARAAAAAGRWKPALAEAGAH